MALIPQQQEQEQPLTSGDLIPQEGPQNFDELIALQRQELAAPDDTDKLIDAQVAHLNNLLYGGQRQEQAPIAAAPSEPDRNYLMEALAGIGSGALGTVGSALSGIERIGERLNIDPSGKDEGWLRVAGEALKEGAAEIKASPDKEIYFKTFNAFGSILGFAAPALIAAPFSGIAAIGLGASLAAGTGADEAYERAIKGGATEEQIDQSVALGTGIGLTEILAPIKILSKLSKVMPDWDFAKKFLNKDGLNTSSTEKLIQKTTKDAQAERLGKVLDINNTGIKEFAKRIATTAGLEGSQEFAAAVGQNAIERYIYKPDADLLNADAIEEGLYGGGAGGMLEAIISTFSMRKSRSYRKKMTEFLDSDQYNQIESQADKAVEAHTKFDEKIAELQKQQPKNAKQQKNIETQIKSLTTQKENAAEKLRRANTLMEKALNDNVYTSNEVITYLSEQVDSKGEPLYNKEYLLELQKSDKKNDTSYLKDVYSKHVQNKRTKHERSAEEELFSEINPETFGPRVDRTYDVQDIERIKEGKTTAEFIVEADARIDDASKHVNELKTQTRKAVLRDKGLGVGVVSEIIDINKADDKVLRTVEALVNKYEAVSDIKKIMESTSTKPITKKTQLTKLLNRKFKEEQEAKKKKADDETQAEIAAAIKAKTDSIKKEEDLSKEGPDSTPDLTQDDEVKRGGPAVGGKVINNDPNITTIEGKFETVDPVNVNTVKEEVKTISVTSEDSGDEVGDIILRQWPIGEGAAPNVTKPFENETITNIDIVKNKSNIAAAARLKEDADKDTLELLSLEQEKEAQEQLNDLESEIENSLSQVIDSNIVESLPYPANLFEEVSVLDKTIKVAEQLDVDGILRAISVYGNSWVKPFADQMSTIKDPKIKEEYIRIINAYQTALNDPDQGVTKDKILDYAKLKKKIRENKRLTGTDAQVLFNKMNEKKEVDSVQETENKVEPTLAELGQERYTELANAVAKMIGLSSSSKAVNSIRQSAKDPTEFVYTFADTNENNVSVKFSKSEFLSEETVDSFGFFDINDSSININVSTGGWAAALNTSAHESFHAAKRLLFSKDQQAVFNSVLTRELAIQNGWKESSYTSVLNKEFPIGEELKLTKEQLAERQRKRAEILDEEAQAYLYGGWYSGENVIGLTPPARNMFDILKDFFNQFKNYIKREIFKQEIKVKEDLTGLVRQQFRDFASGKLAAEVGRLPAQNAASLAAEYIPENSESILKATWAELTKGLTPIGKNKNGQDILQDISIVGRVFSHLHAVSERSPVFKKFYNKLQDRVALRNSIKQTAEILLEKVGSFSGIFKLKNSEVVKVQNLSSFADEAGIDPVFENINTDQATATVTISQANYNEIVDNYGSWTRFLNDHNISLNSYEEVKVDVEVEVEGGVEGETITQQQDNYVMSVTDPKIANAFAGSFKAVEHIGKNIYAGLVHNFLNQPALKGTSINIRTRGSDGKGKDAFNIARSDYKAIEKKLVKLKLLNDEGLLDKAAYTAYEKEQTELGIPDKDRILGGLAFDSSVSSLKLGAQDVLVVLSAVTGDTRKGYFPHYRYGDHAVAVYRKDTKEIVRLETAESKLFESLGGVPLVGDKLKKNLVNKQKELQAKLTEDYGNDFDVEPLLLTLDESGNVDPSAKKTIMDALGVLGTLGQAYTRRVSDVDKLQQVNGFIEMIKAEAVGSRIEALTRKRKNIPGYMNSQNNNGTYYKKSIQRYIDEGSNTASSLFEEPELLDAKTEIAERIQGGITSNLYKLADGTFDYVNNPNNEASFLRSYAFHMFLGFNLSSAVVNLTQTVQATLPILSSITGVGKGTAGVIKAAKDTLRLSKHMLDESPRLGKYGFEFFTTEVDSNGNINTIIDPSRKPKWMPDDEFQMLARLFQKGTIQPIQNMDLGAGTLSQSLDTPIFRTLADSSGFAFGYVENSNRITAALSFYRAAKQDAKNNKKDKFSAFASGTRFSEPVLDDNGNSIENDTEEGQVAFAERMAEMGVEKTQFFMGKENRPTFFRGPYMSAITQFQSFLFQMVGSYTQAFNRALGGKLDQHSPEEQQLLKVMARKQVGMMTMTMMAFGGAMGLPFMENIKELWKFLTENFGDEVGEDIEQSMRETLGPILGYNATDMLLRGLPRGLGIDVSRRTGYGDVIPLRLVMGGDAIDFTGPAIARLWDQVQGINNAVERNTGLPDTSLALAQALLPVGFGNFIEGAIQEPSRGTLTRRGQQILPAGALSNMQRVIKSAGFTPTNVARARERKGIMNYYNYRSKNGKDMYSNRMAVSLSNYISAMKDGDIDTAMDAYQEYLKDYLHVSNHDLNNMATPSKQYNINLKTIEKRAERTQDAMGQNLSSRIRKNIRPELQQKMRDGAIPTSG